MAGDAIIPEDSTVDVSGLASLRDPAVCMSFFDFYIFLPIYLNIGKK